MGNRIAEGAVSALGYLAPATRSGRLVILIYHRVRAQPDEMFPNEVDSERFNWQMALLRRHFSPIALGAAVRQLSLNQLPPRSVAVTFDDGYADNAEIALPILCRHEIPGTFFVAPGFLNGKRMWNDSIIETVRRSVVDEIDLSDIGLGVMPLQSAGSRGRVAELILRTVKHLPPAERSAKVAAICDRVAAPLPDDLMMTDAQVRTLAEAGMEVGAHTVSHPILKNLTDSEARHEIELSRYMLEQITGQTVRAFAYPNGRPGDDYSGRDRNLVAKLGFDYAASTTWGAASHDTDRFQLPRFTPWDRNPSRWLARLLTAFSMNGEPRAAG